MEKLLRIFDVRFIRFLIAGVLNTLFGFLIYSALIIAGVPVSIALLGSTVVGTFFNFVTTGKYVFRDLTPARLPRFLLCYLLVYCVNLMLIALLMKWIGSKILAQALLALPIALISYTLMARIVYVGALRKDSTNDGN